MTLGFLIGEASVETIIKDNHFATFNRRLIKVAVGDGFCGLTLIAIGTDVCIDDLGIKRRAVASDGHHKLARKRYSAFEKANEQGLIVGIVFDQVLRHLFDTLLDLLGSIEDPHESSIAFEYTGGMTIYTTKQFSVDSVGAYVTRLDDASGHPVLFPRTMLGEKLRGGSHVCYPYFGPDAAGVLVQHGFGRTVDWKVTVADDEREIICTYDRDGQDQFAGLVAELRYQLKDEGNCFETHLVVANQGSEPRAVMPGFHPYFVVEVDDIKVNGTSIDLTDFEPFREFPDTQTMHLETAGRLITVTSSRLTHMVVWSDARGEYLCIEPTLVGNGCNSADWSHHLLAPGQTATYSFSISWA